MTLIADKILSGTDLRNHVDKTIILVADNSRTNMQIRYFVVTGHYHVVHNGKLIISTPNAGVAADTFNEFVLRGVASV